MTLVCWKCLNNKDPGISILGGFQAPKGRNCEETFQKKMRLPKKRERNKQANKQTTTSYLHTPRTYPTCVYRRPLALRFEKLASEAWIGKDKEATALSFSNNNSGGGEFKPLTSKTLHLLLLLAPHSIDSTLTTTLPKLSHMYTTATHVLETPSSCCSPLPPPSPFSFHPSSSSSFITAYNTKFCPKNSKFLSGKLMTTRSFNPSSAIVHKQNRCANRRTQALGRCKQTRIESGRAASRVRVWGRGGNRNFWSCDPFYTRTQKLAEPDKNRALLLAGVSTKELAQLVLHLWPSVHKQNPWAKSQKAIAREEETRGLFHTKGPKTGPTRVG